ncbi:MAG: valine--tRNA ligase [Bacteroidales bacterium]|jgi:valyl-tRNA synthetase|nr:valine--tRNA ligase [Bacteroidales bacterium]
MEIPAKYESSAIEKKWYKYWIEKKYFHSEPDDREPYVIVIPPPNVTGVLHMGHMLNNTIQDILVRRARMLGKNAVWVPGTDHASIATEAKVVAKLKNEGIEKNTLTREEFLKYAWEWKEKHGGIILQQLKELGASCDWDREAFTMDEIRSGSVIKVFVDLYNKGLIYRGVRMVNWDPEAKTAVSDEEVIYSEENSKLYYVKYKIVGEDNYLIVATTRPETILGDVAVCVNPNDTRYSGLKGKSVIVPMVNREVPVIFDEYVDMEFGTGCLKITPAHDINDYEIGIKYNLPVIDIFNDDGTLNHSAGLFVGEDRFKARELSVEELKKLDLILKIEDYQNKVGRSERTNSVIEPKLSLQWFLKMEQLSKPALEAVENGNVNLIPSKFKNVYRHWMENVRDWCISRQLWWGHRIPAYYINDTNEFVVAGTEKEAVELAREKTGNKNLEAKDLYQDGDVLDTWFSSWLWPISVFNGILEPENPDFKYYYPTNDLVTAPEILFFWVARMIIAGYEYAGDKPFSNVYLTGIVRDKQRRKMSKSLGNSPDPLDLIKEYGADGVRVGMLLCSPAGGDLLYDNSLPEQGRNFANKIWNAFRLVKSWQVDENIEQPEHSKVAVRWFESKLNETISNINQQFDTFRLSESLMSVYKFFWDDFSAWYLEIIKPEYQKPIDKETYVRTLDFFKKICLLLSPFMPFISEELWQFMKDKNDPESIVIAKWPEINVVDKEILDEFENCQQVVANIRTVRQEKNIPQRDKLKLYVIKHCSYSSVFDTVSIKLGNLEEVIFTEEKINPSSGFLVKTNEYFIPLGNLINKEEEITKLKEELKYTEGFLVSVMKKLGNEKFVNNAPVNVIEIERKKQADAEAKIKILKEQIEGLK